MRDEKEKIRVQYRWYCTMLVPTKKSTVQSTIK